MARCVLGRPSKGLKSDADSKARKVGHAGRLPERATDAVEEYLNQTGLDRIRTGLLTLSVRGERRPQVRGALRPNSSGECVKETFSIAPNGIRDFGQQWDSLLGTRPSACFKLLPSRIDGWRIGAR